MKLSENISIKPYNTFGMDVSARVLAEYESVEELQDLLNRYRGEHILAIGAGSNLLFTKDFDGIILHSKLCYARALDEDKTGVDIEAGSGLVLDDLIGQVVDMGLGGLENLSHIPGEVGASAIQNVGAYGVEAKDVIKSVRTIEIATGQERVFSNEECEYGYRDSIFKNRLQGKYIVIGVVYHMDKYPQLHLDYGNLRTEVGAEASVADVREAVIRVRKQKLPEVAELGSAGSFFKNPIVSHSQFAVLEERYPAIPHYETEVGVKIPAAWLIERCGWKGKTHGGARVYDKQPLVIVNTGTASPRDIIELAAAVAESVDKMFGIAIYPEVNYI